MANPNPLLTGSIIFVFVLFLHLLPARPPVGLVPLIRTGCFMNISALWSNWMFAIAVVLDLDLCLLCILEKQGGNNQGHWHGHSVAQTPLATTEARTTPAEAMMVCTMPACTTRRAGVIGPHTHGSRGKYVVNNEDNTRRRGAIGPHPHRTATRHVVDDVDAAAKPIK